MDRSIEPLLADLRASLEAIYGERLRGMYLYGSRARGDNEPDSDVDVMVLLGGRINPRLERQRTSVERARVCLKHGFAVSLLFVSSNRYDRDLAHSLLRNVRREGVAV